MTKEQADALSCRGIAGPHGWVQWKGTDVCIDLSCSCGHRGHFDGMFMYYWKCKQCGRVWALDATIGLFLVDEGPEPDGCIYEDDK